MRRFVVIFFLGLQTFSASSQFLGDGSDGAYTAAGAENFITNMGAVYTYGTADVSSGAFSVTVNSTAGFSQCDLMLIIQMQGAGAGNYNVSRISSIAGSTINFSEATTSSYSNADKIQVVRIPEFTNVTVGIGTSVTTSAWNGTTGGIIWFYATGTIDISGSINVNGLGFTGGAGNTSGGTGSNGEARGASGTNGACGANNRGEHATDGNGGAFGDGGGGGADCNGGRGGNGSNQGGAGGVGGSGAAGNGPGGGTANGGGGSNSTPVDDTKFILGSGGGGGKAGNGGRGGGGGGGGGANISNTGGPGDQGTDGSNATAGSDGGDGGTGGGMVVVFANSITGAGSVTANSTNGAAGSGTGGAGGDGGVGGWGGDSDCGGANDQSAGGGGGGGDGGDGGDGSGGGGGGAGGAVRLGGISNTFSGTMTVTAGSGGTGGAGGAGGAKGNGGAKGSNGACCSNASNGSDGTAGNAGSTGATGTAGGAGISLSNSTVPSLSITGCAQILPVQLIYFNAQNENGSVAIKWSTASEINNDFFTVEKTVDGNYFEKVSLVDGAGNSNLINDYSVLDDAPVKGISYYRLRQTDFDGKQSASPLVQVNYDTPVKASVFPNIIESNQFYVRTEEEELLVILYNQLGETVFSKVVVQEKGTLLAAVDLDKKLPTGIYLITGTSRNEFFNEKIIIKNNP